MLCPEKCRHIMVVGRINVTRSSGHHFSTVRYIICNKVRSRLCDIEKIYSTRLVKKRAKSIRKEYN